MGTVQSAADTGIAHDNAHRQCVDALAHDAVSACTTVQTAEQHGTEHHLIPSGQAGQYQRPRQMQHACGAYPVSARLLPDAQRQLC
ncbi:hypothetical protein IGB42_04268 [Andreprevotia sp. IGB-42]|nr:hypothetical protein IGB42_04268 [Andreprevotia sp. IGB-42]